MLFFNSYRSPTIAGDTTPNPLLPSSSSLFLPLSLSPPSQSSSMKNLILSLSRRFIASTILCQRCSVGLSRIGQEFNLQCVFVLIFSLSVFLPGLIFGFFLFTGLMQNTQSSTVLARLPPEDMNAVNNMRLLEGSSDTKKSSTWDFSLKFDVHKNKHAARKDRTGEQVMWQLSRFYPMVEIILKGFLMATLFYEPSTRTKFSLESAMKWLGGEVLTTENAREFSSAAKGETLEDSIRTVEGYLDIIVMRHFESGAAQRATATASIPVINAGDGPGQHPTQIWP